MATKQPAVEIPTLSPDVAEAFDRYQQAAEKKRNAEAIGRKQKGIKDEACDVVVKAMGSSPLARLPDGRLINRALKGQDRKAQKATTVEWWELTEVQ